MACAEDHTVNRFPYYDSCHRLSFDGAAGSLSHTEEASVRATIGFIGLGLMGEPMASNILRAGTPLMVWNRTPAKAAQLADLGAQVADGVDTVFQRCDTIFLMLSDAAAIDAVLLRARGRIERRLQGRTLVQMSTTSPAYSASLAGDVTRAGGCYVEAPVSGSRGPAERGELVALVAGDAEAVDRVVPVLDAVCADVVRFGDVPAASTAKLAVNLFLVTMVTGLAESVLFARAQELDPTAFAQVLDGGPMASEVSRAKLVKLLNREHAPQAAAVDVLKNCQLICEAAESAGLALPLITSARTLFTSTVDLGHGGSDMSAVLEALGAGTVNAAAAR